MKNPFKRKPKLTAVQDFHNTMAQAVPTYNKETKTMQMTVNREKLEAALIEKRDEVLADNSSELDEAKRKLEDFKSDKSSVGDFLRELAEVADKHPTHLQIVNFEAGSWEIRRTSRDQITYPPAPVNPSRYSVETLEEMVKVAEKRLAEKIAPYKAALDLLAMSEDVSVGIDAGDYHGLLGGTPKY